MAESFDGYCVDHLVEFEGTGAALAGIEMVEHMLLSEAFYQDDNGEHAAYMTFDFMATQLRAAREYIVKEIGGCPSASEEARRNKEVAEICEVAMDNPAGITFNDGDGVTITIEDGGKWTRNLVEMIYSVATGTDCAAAVC